MSLGTLRQNLMNGFSGAAMVGIAALMPANDPAHAGEAQAAQPLTVSNDHQSTRAIDRVYMPEVDTRDEDAEYGKFIAAEASQSHAILKIHGNDEDLYQRARLTMRTMVMGGKYEYIGLIRANGDPKEMEVYVAGDRYATLYNAGASNTESAIISFVREAYDKGIRPYLSVISAQTFPANER